MIQQIFGILGNIFKAFVLLKSEAIKYVFYTGSIAFVLLGILAWGIWKFSTIAGEYISEWIPWSWAQNSIVFSVVVGIAVIVLSWIIFKYILLAVLSPLLSLVSEKIEKRQRGHNLGKGFSVAASAARGVRVNARNIIKEITITLILLVIGLIPGIHFIALLLLFLTQAYFAGFGIMDFYLERHYTFRESISEVYNHKWAAITLGSIFTGLLLIPFVGVLIAPYFCTAAATRYFIAHEDKSQGESLLSS